MAGRSAGCAACGGTATTDTKSLVAGSPWVFVSHVLQPTIAVYAPKKNNTGAAMIVFPGRGYEILAIVLIAAARCPPAENRGKCLGFYVCACDFAAVNRNGENLSALNSDLPLTIQSRTIFAVMGASRIPFR